MGSNLQVADLKIRIDVPSLTPCRRDKDPTCLKGSRVLITDFRILWRRQTPKEHLLNSKNYTARNNGRVNHLIKYY